jgi:hypothetical protein
MAKKEIKETRKDIDDVKAAVTIIQKALDDRVAVATDSRVKQKWAKNTADEMLTEIGAIYAMIKESGFYV